MRKAAGLLILALMLPSAHAALFVNPLSVDFFGVRVNQSQMQMINVQNGGPKATVLTVNNTCFVDFNFLNMCYGELQPGQECTVQLTFRPSRTGYQSCDIWFEDSSGESYTVSVSGQGN